ncbi:MAG TPA: hypothetical protein VM282_16510 [Acidimicrobiales bacterium]|nr:hypothetical protein [Acidimicrobiales bacterium]
MVIDDQAPFRSIARTVISVPDAMLMDIDRLGMSGLEATRRIVAVAPSTVVVLLSTYSDRDLLEPEVTRGALRSVHKAQFGRDVLADVGGQRNKTTGGGS